MRKQKLGLGIDAIEPETFEEYKELLTEMLGKEYVELAGDEKLREDFLKEYGQ